MQVGGLNLGTYTNKKRKLEEGLYQETHTNKETNG